MHQRERDCRTVTHSRRIERAEESTYVDIPFQMPENVEEIHVAYKVESHGTGKGLQASPKGESESNLEADAAGRAFYRAEVWRHFTEVDRTLMAAVTNPIYFE